jgi:hypothetical protein
MRPGRPTQPVTLTLEERETLTRWSQRPKTAQALAQRARIVLGCAAGETHTALARQLRLTKQTVGKWRARFLATRLDGCSMSRARGRRARSPMRRWSAC